MIFSTKSILKTHLLNSCSIINQRLFEQDCLLCAAPSGAQMLCPACHASLPHIAHACPRCATPSTKQVCGACLQHPPSFDHSCAALEYAFPTDKLIQALKYGGQLALAKLLGQLLAEAVTKEVRPDLIVAMPLHPTRLKSRGFNQALEIAKVVAKRLDIPLATGMTQRVLDTAPQALLALDARHKNIKGAFNCPIDLPDQRIAIVDDVMTSGATVNELAKTLKRAGAAEVHAWIVARASTRH